MLLLSLLFTPIIGILVVLINKDNGISLVNIKFIALASSIFNFFISLIIFILFDFSTNQFQFVQEYHQISYFDFYLGVDGLSIYFILLTTLIIPISLISNWKSIIKDVESFVIIILLLETLLLAVFLVLDILLFYIFFESILPPLFILIGIFGSDNRVKASFYLFLYTLFGSLFLLLSILAMSSIMSTTDFDTLFKGNFVYITQLFLFYGIFIAFAVKTPTIFLNTWLLKAHVESPLGGSIILAAIVLKLSLYGILRLILPILPKAYMEYTYIIFLIGVITIIYASLSTLRTIDIKELIAYSSVSHAAVYLLGVFSNSIQGIEGSINLGLAHGLVSPGLFICAGGVLYDRSSTRVISFYKGVAQVMPLFAILFFILCLANCGAPLSLNFIGEFLSLYGVFEKSSLFGLLASSSIIFSAAYTIYMFQRIAFGGAYSRMFAIVMPDLTKREFTVLLILVIPTIFFGIYPAPILDAIHYSTSTLIYCFDSNVISCDGSKVWDAYFQSNTISHHTYIALFFWILVIGLTITYSSYIKIWYVNNIKYWYYREGRYLLYGIFHMLPLPFLVVTLFYIIVYLHSILSGIYFGLCNNIFMYNPLHDYAIANDIDPHSVVFNNTSPKVQDHIYLSSRGNSHPYLGHNRGTHSPQNMQGQEVPATHSPQNMQGQEVPRTLLPQNGQIFMVQGSNPPRYVHISRIPGSNPPQYMQIALPATYQPQNMQVHEEPKVSIFKPNWQDTHVPYVPKPPKSPVLVYGQGDNPVLWTTAEHGETLDRYNTYNVAPGQVDYCDRTKSTHGWMQLNNWNRSRHHGPCFHCRETVSNVFYTCDHCFRRVCSNCNDHVFNGIPSSTMDKLRAAIASRK